MDYMTVLSEILRPMNIIFFCFGVFSALLVQSLKNRNNQQIVLEQKEVLLARFSKWAGFFAIILSFYLIMGPGGWVFDDMVYLTKHAIILNSEYISEVTTKNTLGNAMMCSYGDCMNRTIICTGSMCFYSFSKNESDAPNGSILFSNLTKFEYNGSKLVIQNQSLPKKAEIR